MPDARTSSQPYLTITREELERMRQYSIQQLFTSTETGRWISNEYEQTYAAAPPPPQPRYKTCKLKFKLIRYKTPPRYYFMAFDAGTIVYADEVTYSRNRGYSGMFYRAGTNDGFRLVNVFLEKIT